jgi:hypothetical protein
LTNISKTTLWFTLKSALKSMVFIVFLIWIVLIISELPSSKGKLIVPIENKSGSLANVESSSSLMMPF